MNAIAFAVVICAVLGYAVWCDMLPLASRLVGVLERKYPAPEVQRAESTTLPPDVETLAQGESEEWAREAVRERAWELFRFTKNWDEAKRILHAERMVTLLGGEPGRGVN